jgi:hypothetical protein
LAKVFKHLRTLYMQEEEGTLAGSNSGTCAINLAYQQMEAGDTLFLLGFDMCRGPDGEAYWYPPYSWNPEGATKPGNYRDWVNELQSFKAQFVTRKMNVFNVTHRSDLFVFPKITFEQMMGMLNDE